MYIRLEVGPAFFMACLTSASYLLQSRTFSYKLEMPEPIYIDERSTLSEQSLREGGGGPSCLGSFFFPTPNSFFIFYYIKQGYL